MVRVKSKFMAASDTHYSSDEHTVTAASLLMRPHAWTTFRK